jgi:hypothetical protein
MPAPLRFSRHFLLLAAAVIVIVALNAANPFSEPFLPSFALYGALHAAALAVAIQASHSLPRKGLFIVLAAALNVAVLYAGIFSLEVLGKAFASLRLYIALSVCAMFGAMAYGLLIRAFWYPALRPRAIAQIAFGCAFATAGALGIENLAIPIGTWSLAAVWWFAFSLGLWHVDRRTNALRPQPHPQ